MAITTTRWNSSEHLKTEEDIQLYLEACMEDAGDDPSFIIHALGVIAKARNMSQLARDTGLSNLKGTLPFNFNRLIYILKHV